ncbi:MAG TPA: zinc-dependent metalloprotease family protein [Pyrinomonadaceae bacterium]|nr:zinc-dependent metalloprotease family protein [Pyrinomonadaceae bacterium]
MSVFGQDGVWSRVESLTQVPTKRSVQRSSFPKQFKLFGLNREGLDQNLFAVVDRPGQPTIVSLPNADGRLEQFELFEASNFEPKLQERFPDIRSFSGRGITDRHATVKLSVSPQGVQGTVFRTASGFMEFEAPTEIIEPYSADGTIYAVFQSQRTPGKLPWACTAPIENELFSQWKQQIDREQNLAPESNTGEVRTMRLAQSVNGEYSNYFGATSSAQVNLVLAAINATLTRSNGVYERDLGLHLNLIPETTNLIFYDPATDPYSDDLGNWNDELAGAIAANGITPEMYDIGHMFGASGGGGNAGCIGCVCSTTHDKGMGITSPADDIPEGDNFDIDYVVHEVGHQLGANHTFSYGQIPYPEGYGQDKEIGSGITIMGYAGITPVSDVAPHSIDIFHETSIGQIQENLPTRGCPAAGTVPSTGNRAPVVAAIGNYTIPIMTPFRLTGSATDPDGDAVTYNWEQDDSAENTGITIAAASANPTKLVGPNWLSFNSTSSPTKYFPRLATILAGEFTTSAHAGGDPGVLIEALSAVTRDLNFRLTVRDNHPYVPGMAIGQTQHTDMRVSVTNLAGPFKVTAPDSPATWLGGTTRTVTWQVANTNLPPVGTAMVNIRLSLNGGQTFPIVLKANTPNDGTEPVVVPNIGTDTARIMVESVGNIFLDISDAGFSILGPTTASVGGRTLDRFGRGIKGVVVTLTSADGSERSVVTGSNGSYVFDAVPLGQTYTIRPSHRTYGFTPASIEYLHVEETTNQNFAGTR